MQLATWQTAIADQGPPIIQPDDVTTFETLFDEVRAEQTLLSRVTLAAVVPLIVLALLLLYVLVASAAEVRRQEVALAKLRGFSTGKVVRFAVAEPAAVLLLTVPVGIGSGRGRRAGPGRDLARPDPVRGDHRRPSSPRSW